MCTRRTDGAGRGFAQLDVRTDGTAIALILGMMTRRDLDELTTAADTAVELLQAARELLRRAAAALEDEGQHGTAELADEARRACGAALKVALE